MKNSIVSFLLVAAVFAACKKDETRQKDTSYNPAILASNFTNPTALTNPYFPFQSGKKYIYEGQTDEGFERIEIQLTNQSKTVMGIACAVVRDRVWIDNVLVEDTDDWYAQDNDGTVWYMGEYVTDYNPDGSVKDHSGAWEAGVDDAKAGVQMLASPAVGMKYRQEYYFNEAEDEAEIVETGKIVTIPLGTYENCIVIKEWTDLEQGHIGHKTYAPGIGMIQDGDNIRLVKIE
jgi:hypothetical protein